jgi:hypothetical protein
MQKASKAGNVSSANELAPSAQYTTIPGEITVRNVFRDSIIALDHDEGSQAPVSMRLPYGNRYCYSLHVEREKLGKLKATMIGASGLEMSLICQR